MPGVAAEGSPAGSPLLPLVMPVTRPYHFGVGDRGCLSGMVRRTLGVAALSMVVLLLGSGQALGSPTTERVSVSSSGEQADQDSWGHGISRNARFVVFSSQADNLVVDDHNYAEDIFVRDRTAGTTTRINLSSAGEEANGFSDEPQISANGRYVVYITYATNLTSDTNFTGAKLMLYDRLSQSTTFISPETNGPRDPVISANGGVVAYSDAMRDWTIDVYDRETDTTSFASVNAAGDPANGASMEPAISATGRLVAFKSRATNLTPRRDTNNTDDIFIHNLETGNTTEVSLNSDGQLGDLGSRFPALSANGRYVAFESLATNLVRNDTNGQADVFVRDRQTGTTSRVSVGWMHQQGNGYSCCPSISADGSRISFLSWSTNLKPSPTHGSHLFLRDMSENWLQLVDVSSAGVVGDHNEYDAGMVSADGSHVAFDSPSTNLVPDDNSASDVFVRGPFD